MSARPSSSSTSHLPIVPTVPQPIHALANPSPVLIDSQLPNYLIPAVSDLLHQSTQHVLDKRRQEEAALRVEGLLPKGKAKEYSVDEEAARRMERIGLMVGGHVAERLTLARPPLASHLDIIKFICKDLFLYVYSKQIDNLRTNHRGVFVLQSHVFPPLMSLSSRSPVDVKKHLVFPQALIQGALVRLGMNATVTLESTGLPQCTFQIRTTKAVSAPATPALDNQQGRMADQPSVGGTGSTGLGITS